MRLCCSLEREVGPGRNREIKKKVKRDKNKIKNKIKKRKGKENNLIDTSTYSKTTADPALNTQNLVRLRNQPVTRSREYNAKTSKRANIPKPTGQRCPAYNSHCQGRPSIFASN